MFKHIIKYSLSAVLLAGIFASCAKEEEVGPALNNNGDKPTNKLSGFGLALSAVAEDPAMSSDARMASYDLVGEKMRPEINFLHIKNATPEQLQRSGEKSQEAQENYGKVPVHLFFVNTKLGEKSLRYYVRYMEVKDKKTLILPFQNYEGVEQQYQKDNADYWYVKGFIGGVPTTSPYNSTRENVLDIRSKSRREGNANVTGILFQMDNLMSFEPGETSSYITRTIIGNYRGWDYTYQQPLPFPMETPWKKIRFRYEGSEDKGVLGQGNDSQYPNELQTLVFKPLGALMRLQVDNQLDADQPVTVFDFSPARLRSGERVLNGSYVDSELQQKEQIYCNAVLREIKSRIRNRDGSYSNYTVHFPVDASGYMTEEATTQPWAGAKTVPQTDGKVHYHAKEFANPGTVKDHKAVYIKAGSSRTFFFWLIENTDYTKTPQSLTRARVYPFFQNVLNISDAMSPDPRYTYEKHQDKTKVLFEGGVFKPIYLRDASQEHAMWVERGKWKSGYTYFIKSNLVKKDQQP